VIRRLYSGAKCVELVDARSKFAVLNVRHPSVGMQYSRLCLSSAICWLLSRTSRVRQPRRTRNSFSFCPHSGWACVGPSAENPKRW